MSGELSALPGTFTTLGCESLGIDASLDSAIELAAEFGFDAVEPELRHLAGLEHRELRRVRDAVAARGLRWGWAELPVDLHADDDDGFARQLKGLRHSAEALHAVGVDRIGTWIRPMSAVVPYERNILRHV